MTVSIISLSGTLTHGSTIIVSGSGFGSHADYNYISNTWQGKDFLCRIWKDFEDNTIESDGLSVDTYDENWTVQTSGGRTNSTYFGRKQPISVRLGGLNSSNTSETEYFVSFWAKIATGTLSFKPVRFYTGTSNDVTLFIGIYNEDTTTLRGTDGLVTEWGQIGQIVYDAWQRIDIYVRDVASNDHGVWAYRDCVLRWSHINESGAWPPSYPYGSSNISFAGVSEVGDSFDIDDIYCDHTRARVEIGDASTWAGCTHGEIQIPSSWDAGGGTLQFTVNRGSFGASEIAYLYVVDSTGTANTSGYPIQFGETYNGSSSQSPSKLQIKNIVRPQHFRKVHPKF